MELSQHQSPLLKLRPEIRNIIYGFCCPPPGKHGGVIVLKRIKKLADIPSILVTCKKVYKEAYPIICGSLRIDVAVAPRLKIDVFGIGNLKPASIRHLSLNCTFAKNRYIRLELLRWFNKAVVNLHSLHVHLSIAALAPSCLDMAKFRRIPETSWAILLERTMINNIKYLSKFCMRIKTLQVLEFSGEHRERMAKAIGEELARRGHPLKKITPAPQPYKGNFVVCAAE
ncbi:hypothetical protein F5B20DRAFT_595961 [Whalleya microplaca]|nr:hypothetical protein F5B20DRAFT_595961 [Whalleya microplaca]